MKNLISQLNNMGFRTTLWTFPFFNFDSETFVYVVEKNFVATEGNSELPSLSNWWDGILAASLDPTNNQAADWFVGELNKIRNSTGIDSFKFDAGLV